MSKRKRRKGSTAKRQKAGAPYEDTVCELFRRFFPSSAVNAGVWLEGPDGRREVDIHIVEKQGDRTVRGVVECKDFNPATTGPVGIGYIDALDSKRKDLGFEFAFVCSNAGFTEDAIRKAKRVDIGLLGAARKGDSRIRFGVVDEIYTRHIRLTEPARFHFFLAHGEPLPAGPAPAASESDEIKFEGRPVDPWLFGRLLATVGANPIVKGRFQCNHRLKAPIRIDTPLGDFMVQEIGIEFAIEGAWFAQTVRIDSTAGLYDWLRRRMRLAPSPHPRHIQIVGINYYGGNWIKQPPDVDWANRKLLPYETEMRFIVWKDLFPQDNPALLTSHVEDLNVVVNDLDEAAIESVPGFTPDPVPASEVGKKRWQNMEVVVHVPDSTPRSTSAV